MKKKLYNLMMLVVVFALALTACGSNQPAATPQSAEPVSVSSDGIVAEGKLKPAQAVNLSFQVRGMVEEVNVKIGDKVSKGDVLARLSNVSQGEAQLAMARLEVVAARQALDTLKRTSDVNLAATWDA